SRPGSGVLTEPVAMTIDLAEISWGAASPSSVTRPGAAMRPLPFSHSTLFFLKRNSMPRVRVVTTLSLRARAAADDDDVVGVGHSLSLGAFFAGFFSGQWSGESVDEYCAVLSCRVRRRRA